MQAKPKNKTAITGKFEVWFLYLKFELSYLGKAYAGN